MVRAFWPILLLVVTAATTASARSVSITRETCEQVVVEHVPDAGVTYQAGVDVNGNPVPPADVQGSPTIVVPQEFSIPITVDLGKRLGIPVDPNDFQSNADIGTLTYKDGQVYFNGQPLQDSDEAALARACQQVMRGN